MPVENENAEQTTTPAAVITDKDTAPDAPIVDKKAAPKSGGLSKKTQTDVYEHGFKIPLEIHPQHANADRISFRIGNAEYKVSPADAIKLANTGGIKPGSKLGAIPWSAAIGLFVNNLDGGRNKAMNDILEKSKADALNNNLT